MGKSIRAKAITFLVHGLGFVVKSEKRYHAYYRYRLKAREKPLPKRITEKKNVSVLNVAGSQVLVCGDSSSERCIMYMHGGGFALEITSLHAAFCRKLAERTGYCVYAPAYPLLPHHHYDETYRLVDELYCMIKDKAVIFMGDSSGGGFVFSYAQHLRDRGEKLPEQIIGISPWLDLSMSSSDHSALERRDPMLGVSGSIFAGELWANGLDTKDPRVSAMFGDNTGLPPSTIFVGTDEIFYPDALLYANKLKDSGVRTGLIIGDRMNHIYPIYPIPEADKALDQIVRIVLEGHDDAQAKI